MDSFKQQCLPELEFIISVNSKKTQVRDENQKAATEPFCSEGSQKLKEPPSAESHFLLSADLLLLQGESLEQKLTGEPRSRRVGG